MKINDTKVFKHQFWLCRDGLVMLITDIREGEPRPIKGIRGSFCDDPASEFSWNASGRMAKDFEDFDMIRRVLSIQIGKALEEAA